MVIVLSIEIAYCQPKGANTIRVSDVTFRDVAKKLLDAGYTFDKIDSNFQTVKTEFRKGFGKNEWMKIRFFIRMKDSSAIITGQWYNTLMTNKSPEEEAEPIEFTSGNPKSCFIDMKNFALSFSKPVEYSISK